MMRLSIFILIFLMIYGAMHALVFFGVRPLLGGRGRVDLLLALWMIAMVAAPILVRVLDREGHAGAARVVGWISYCWMGFLFLAFCAFLLVLLWHPLALAAAGFLPGRILLTLYSPAGIAAVLLLVTAAGLYGFYEAQHLRIERIEIRTENLPAGVERLRIVQVSDLHLGLLHHEESLAPIVSAIEELRPDLLVATGDMVDGQMDHLNGLSALWQRLNPPLGKFAVTGNHEFYAGLRQAIEFTRRSGFVMLRNEATAIGDTLIVAGVDDPAGGGDPDELPVLQSVDRNGFTLLLKHRPIVNPAASGLFDLQLSGHAHRGQIFPFNLLTGLEYPMQNGLYVLAGGSHLYTSRGTGTWGPPMRLLAPPEITLIEIVRKQ